MTGLSRFESSTKSWLNLRVTEPCRHEDVTDRNTGVREAPTLRDLSDERSAEKETEDVVDG